MAKEIPHDLTAEKSLLGCLLVDQQAFDGVSDLRLTEGDFYHPQHGYVYQAISDLAFEHKPIDYVTLVSRLKEVGKLEASGGVEAITDLADSHATSSNIYHYAKIVKDKAEMRKIIRMAKSMVEEGLNFSGTPQDYIQNSEARFFELINKAKSFNMKTLRECAEENYDDLTDESRRPGEIDGLPTGFQDLDQLLLGLQSGQLVILAARPSMGKTSLALNIASKLSQQDFSVAIFSLEMSCNELSMRMLTSEARVDSSRVRRKNLQEADLLNLSKTKDGLKNRKVFISDSGSVTLADIQSQSRRLKAEHGLGLIIVDYLQMMSPLNKSLPREQQISEMSRGLKILAKELGCPVLALSQLNRSVETRIDKRPNNSDLRESGAIEQDADIVLFIYRDDYYNKEESKEPGVAEVIVSKNRSGKTGIAKLKWMEDYTTFENIDHFHEY